MEKDSYLDLERTIPSNIEEIKVKDNENIVLTIGYFKNKDENETLEFSFNSFNSLRSGKWLGFMTEDDVLFFCHEDYANHVFYLESSSKEINKSNNKVVNQSDYQKLFDWKTEIDSVSRIINDSMYEFYRGSCFGVKIDLVDYEFDTEKTNCDDFVQPLLDGDAPSRDFMVQNKNNSLIFDVREKHIKGYYMLGVLDDVVGVTIIPEEENENPLSQMFEQLSDNNFVFRF